VVSFCGGVELETWKPAMLKLIQHYAFDTQCDGVEATARAGWAKVLKNDGYKALWQTFEFPVETHGLQAL
jgi:hypothetical protein